MDSDDSTLKDCEEDVWPPYMAFDDVIDHINFANFVQVWQKINLVDTPYISSSMEDMGMTAFGLALEHHNSIIELTKSGHAGSAAALTRVLFETFVRGVWLINVKDHNKLKNFEIGKDTRDPQNLITDLSKLSGSDKYLALMDAWDKSKATLHDFAHSGLQAIFRRSSHHEPTEEEFVSMLRFSTGVAVNSILEALDFLKSHLSRDHEPDAVTKIEALEKQAYFFQGRLALSEKNGARVLRIKVDRT